MSFESFFFLVFEDFVSPAQRTFLPVLLSSIALAWIILRISGKRAPWAYMRKKLLNKDIFLHPSSILDCKILLLNNGMKMIFFGLFSGLLWSSHSLSVFFIKILRAWGISPITDNTLVAGLFYTIFSFVLLDFFRFFQHYLMHKVGFLWKFHRLHHSAEVLTPLTLHRVHPVEMFIGLFVASSAIAISSSFYVCLFQIPLHGHHIFGVNLLGFLFNVSGANLRHSHIWLGFGWAEYLFISPAQHQIHHSKNPLHFNKNLGICLSIWDIAFGSFLRARGEFEIEMGLENQRFKAKIIE